ncbi:MAG: cytochrome C oxidase subunit IV family protein [Helicobacteraceae bacterium]|nr:cytochrome C oxidase subunit IV family protein [Candidatus Sulfurimonas ponti]MBL6973392.1 cytochrome C oxidase subunit IV family protein [Sulfurimonas sp.]
MSTKVWSVLVFLSVITFLSGLLNLVNPYVVGILLVSVLLKGYLISEHFMGLSEVSFRYRIIPIVWLFIVLSLIGYTYYA